MMVYTSKLCSQLHKDKTVSGERIS